MTLDYVEVGNGAMARAGDKVISPSDEVIVLDELQALMHNEFEPNGYAVDSYRRFRINVESKFG